MSDSDSQTSLTDKQKLQDAEDTIHELQHELEKLQMELAEAKEGDPKSQKIETLEEELKTTKVEHAVEIVELKEQLMSLQTQHTTAMELVQENHRLQVEQHQENLEELGNLLRFRQQEQLDTLQDFTAKLTQVGEIHQEAVQILESKHQEELAKQKAELLAPK